MFEESINSVRDKFFYIPRESIVNDNEPHDDDIVAQIRLAYVFGLIAWLAIVILLKLYETDFIGTIILLIPIVVFLIGYYNADVVTPEIEKEMFTTNYLSVGLIVILPLLVWITDKQSKNKSKFIALLVMAIILTLLSMIDIWVSKRELSAYHHVRSMLQTLSIVIIIYALYIFYLEKYAHIINDENRNREDTEKLQTKGLLQQEKDDYCENIDVKNREKLGKAALVATSIAALDLGSAISVNDTSL